jgi:hypothetical protein
VRSAPGAALDIPTLNRVKEVAMNARTLARSTLALWTGLLMGLTPGLAAAQNDELPAVQESGNVRFVSGGIGLDQSAAFKAAMGRYPLSLQIAHRENGRNAYTADAQVRILDRMGGVALETRAEGPFLLVDLPNGRYQVEVTLDGVTQRKTIQVGAEQPARGFFLFGGG